MMKLVLALIFLLLTMNYAISGRDYSNTFQIGAAGTTGNKTIEFGSGGDQGCLRYNDTSNEMESSDDCTTYGAIGGGSDATAAKYTTSAAQSINDLSTTIIDYDSTTHGYNSANGISVTTGTGWQAEIDAGAGGYYEVCASITYGALTLISTEVVVLYLYKNGASVGILDYFVAHETINKEFMLRGCTDIELSATDTVNVRTFHNSGGAEALKGDKLYNQISINKI